VGEGRPSDAPGERRLERPPSERYATPEDAAPAASGLSRPRRVAIGALIAVVGAVAIAVGGGLLAITAGLVVVAVAVGWGVGTIVSLGAEPDPPSTTWTAVALTVLGIGLGQVGLWLIARQEGGVLGLVDYLGETFGFLVPLQFLVGAVTAWWGAR
jgi:hypothetical protein